MRHLIAFVTTWLMALSLAAQDQKSEVVLLEGGPEEIATQLVRQTKEPVKVLLNTYLKQVKGQAPQMYEAAVKAIPAAEKQINADHLAEIKALAKESGVDYTELMFAHLFPSFFCSALYVQKELTSVGRPLFARNLEWRGYQLLGPATIITIVRPKGKYAFANITWPGFTSVVSGMNEHGLASALLLRDGHAGPEELLTSFIAREVLEQCKSVSEARAYLKKRTGNQRGNYYLFVGDATGDAFVMEPYQDPAKFLPPFLFHSVAEGYLVSTNSRLDPPYYRIECPRFWTWLKFVSQERGKIDVDKLRGALKATALQGQNVQEMVFDLQEQALYRAKAGLLGEASTAKWTRYDLKTVLTSQGDISSVTKEDRGKAPTLYEPAKDSIDQKFYLEQFERGFMSHLNLVREHLSDPVKEETFRAYVQANVHLATGLYLNRFTQRNWKEFGTLAGELHARLLKKFLEQADAYLKANPDRRAQIKEAMAQLADEPLKRCRELLNLDQKFELPEDLRSHLKELSQ